MPGFGDSAFIVLLALLLFGPKKLPVLARQLGKLMADFRRASNEFRSQMEEELRVSEQADRQKQISAIEAAAPIAPTEPHIPPAEPSFVMPDDSAAAPTTSLETAATAQTIAQTIAPTIAQPPSAPLPIATSGSLDLMPPATGLPVGRTPANSSLKSLVDAIPQAPEPEVATMHPAVSNGAFPEASAHANGTTHEPAAEAETPSWTI